MTLPVEKMIYVGRRNPNLPAEDFPARWKQHAVLSATVATVADAVSGMAQCSRMLDAQLSWASDAFDGVSLMMVTDPRRIFASQKEQQHIELLLPDELIVFTDYVFKSTVVAHERLIHAGPIERAKNKIVVVDVLTRKDGVSSAEFDRRWAASSRNMSALPGFETTVQRFVQNTLYGERPPGHDYDGISELWFDSMDDAELLLTDVARENIDSQLGEFVDLRKRTTLVTRVSHAFYRPGVLAVPTPA